MQGGTREGSMHAQILTTARQPLVPAALPDPRPGPQQLLIAVRACAVCRTDLHVVDGELPDPKLPLVPGHEIIGTVVEKGTAAERFAIGDRVGVPWLGWTCGVCEYCRGGAADVRRADRLPHPAHGWRGAVPRDLRLWRRRPHRRTGGPSPGSPAV